MLDLILLTFCAGLFIAGFWCGKTFLTFDNMKDAGMQWVKTWWE